MPLLLGNLMLFWLFGCTVNQEPPVAAKPDVVIIVIDTLRVDHLNEKTAPFISKLKKESLDFENAWSTSSWTAPSTASIFTGQHPIEHGVYEGFVASFEEGATKKTINRLSPKRKTLPERFKEAGYNTYGVASNINLRKEIIQKL